MNEKPVNSRQTAAEIISRWFEDGSFPDRELANLKQNQGFLREVVNGIIRQHAVFDWLEARWLRKPPAPYFRALLRVGLYQLLFMDRVEAYAALNETVEAAKTRSGGEGAAKMINAVLRRAQREKEEVLAELEKQPAHIRVSHPELLLKRWIAQYGEADALELAAWNNRPPETVLRIEQSAVDATEFVDRLREQDIEPLLHPYSDQEVFLVLPRGTAVRDVPGYDEGWFFVQDPATSISVDLLAPRSGETVLDACAAPGGKTAMIASRMKGRGKLTAMDLHADRIALLNENRRRLKLDWVDVVQGDARNPQNSLGDQQFDAILLDVPCLNTGVLRRRSDARWRIDPQRIEEITRLQTEILDACAALLKPKGRLVYSTCSLEAEENEDLVGRWIGTHPEFRLARTDKAFPPESGTDGAFAALLRKK